MAFAGSPSAAAPPLHEEAGPGSAPVPSPALLGLALGFIAVYAGLDWITQVHASRWFPATPWNPQPALAVALVTLGGVRLVPVVALAAGVGDALAQLPAGWTPGSAVAALAGAAVYVATGLVLRRWPAIPEGGSMMTRLSRLLLASIACALAAAFVSQGLR